MSDRPNLPVPDELHDVREQIRKLSERETYLRELLITNADLREGASYYAKVTTAKQDRTDWKELRACHPDLVAEFTYPLDVTRVTLLGVTEDGELVPARSLAKD